MTEIINPGSSHNFQKLLAELEQNKEAEGGPQELAEQFLKRLMKDRYEERGNKGADIGA
ncbi:MAG: hypothetical protein WCO55_00120 [Candidatus Falkowbacteria bacterium]